MLEIKTQESVSFDQLTVMDTGWEACFSQLGPSSKESRVTRYQADQACVHSVQFGATFDQRVHARPSMYSFGLLGMDSSVTWARDRAIPADGLVVFPWGEQDDKKIVSTPQFCAKGVHFSDNYLALIAEQVFKRKLESIVPVAGIYEPAPEAVEAVRTELAKWQQLEPEGAANRGAIISRREEGLALVILEALLQAQPFKHERPLKTEVSLRRALDIIHDSEYEQISAAELCVHANCSQRSLELAFLKRFGVTPKKYIKYIRIAQVRRGLLNFDAQGCASIIELASANGFWHMGQFAADYHKIYGELPSETLNRH
jgi:AraC family transcriptional regulator, ethanolamine operon transcriptional activator